MPQYMLKGIRIWKWKIHALEPFEGRVVYGDDWEGAQKIKKKNQGLEFRQEFFARDIIWGGQGYRQNLGVAEPLKRKLRGQRRW